MTVSTQPANNAARERLAKALQRQLDLANAAASRPDLDAEYERAVAEVAAASAALEASQ
jgi:hypothetical protein